MKNKIKTIICFLMIAIVTIIIIPVIINIAYKQNVTINIFKPEWDASASLTYYGSLLAAGIAIIGVFLTIRYSQNNYKEDTRNRMLPFIIAERLSIQIDKTLYDPEYLTVEEERNDGYKEYALDDFSFILENGNIIYSSLSIRQKRMMKNGGVMLHRDTTGEHLKKYNNYIGIPLKIENIGNGPAINLRFGLDRAEVQDVCCII